MPHMEHAQFMGLNVLGMLLSNLFWLFLLVGLVWLLVRAISAAGTRPRPSFAAFRPDQPPFQPPVQNLSSLEILRQRYARGEINATTFDQMRERLGASDRPEE